MAELFRLPPERWSGSLAPVAARFGPRVRSWHLGRADDDSFTRRSNEPALAAIRGEFARVGRNVRLGVPWPAGTPPQGVASVLRPLPERVTPLLAEDDISPPPDAPEPAVPTAVNGSVAGVLFAVRGPSPRAGDAEQRAAALVFDLLRAKQSHPEAVLFDDVFSAEAGLLTARGEPTVLFLPWKTAVAALDGARDSGRLPLAGGSPNRVLVRGAEATLVIWNDEPTTEIIVLGGQPRATDVWGRPVTLEPKENGRVALAVGRSPLLVTGASAALLQWQMAARLEDPRLDSRYGPQPAAVVGRNPFGQGVSAEITLELPRGWQAEPSRWELSLAAGETFRLPCLVTLPSDVNLGPHEAAIGFRIEADQSYRLAVPQNLRVGRGDVELTVGQRRGENGMLEITQTLTNRTAPAETLNFRCSLYVPGRPRQRQYVVKLGTGDDVKRYHLDRADALAGQTVWLRAEQEDGTRILNYRWQVEPASAPGSPPGTESAGNESARTDATRR